MRGRSMRCSGCSADSRLPLHRIMFSLSPYLLRSLTTDAGHLNEAGRRAQAALLSQLSASPSRDLWQQLLRLPPSATDQPSVGSEDSVVASLAVAAFLAIRCKSSDLRCFVPLVHTPLFALERLLPLLTLLWERSEVQVSDKALALLDHYLHLVGPSVLSPSFYDLMRLHPIHKSLVRVMQYSSDASCRKRAVETFKKLVCAFEPRGRVRVTTILVSDPEQASGVIELLLLQYRQFLVTESSRLYAGENLMTVVKRSIAACVPRDDVVASADLLLSRSEAILALLNLLRFLLLSGLAGASETAQLTSLTRDRVVVPLQRQLESARRAKDQELTRVSQLDSHSRGEAVAEMRKMQVMIENDTSSQQHLLSSQECPDDFQEQGLRVSLVKLDMIQSVVDILSQLVV